MKTAQLAVPTSHLNGTSKPDLQSALVDAHNAVDFYCCVGVAMELVAAAFFVSTLTVLILVIRAPVIPQQPK